MISEQEDWRKTTEHDNAGHLTKVTDGSSNIWQFAYDHIGRLTQTQATYSFVGGRTFTTSYTYDAAGNRTSMTDPANGVTNYSYDSLNRLTGVNDFNSNSFGFSRACPERSRRNALSRRTQLTEKRGLRRSLWDRRAELTVRRSGTSSFSSSPAGRPARWPRP